MKKSRPPAPSAAAAKTRAVPIAMPPATPKRHWSMVDCFHDPALPVRAFVHRNYTIGMHTHDFFELNLVTGGEGCHFFDGQRFALACGDVFVIPPGAEHAYFSEDQLDVAHILIPRAFLESAGGRLRLQPGFQLLFSVEPYLRVESGFRYRLRLTGERLARMRQLIDWLIEECADKEGTAALAVESLMLHLLCLLARWQAQAAQQRPGKQAIPADRMQSLQAVFALVERGYGQKIGLEELAGAAHLEKSHFCRVFHKATGMRPLEYVTLVRVQAARELLLNSERDLSAIALQTGFYDAAHFSRTFSRLTGESPSLCRRKGR